MNEKVLLQNIEKIKTTELGAIRIRRNLSLDLENVVDWCCDKIRLPHAIIEKKGKNWYIHVDDCIITVNASSYTIITAHKEKKNVEL